MAASCGHKSSYYLSLLCINENRILRIIEPILAAAKTKHKRLHFYLGGHISMILRRKRKLSLHRNYFTGKHLILAIINLYF